jgi:hypothetical protein
MSILGIIQDNIIVIYEIKSFYVTLAAGRFFPNNIHRANYHFTHSKKLKKKPDNTTVLQLGGIVYRKRPLPISHLLYFFLVSIFLPCVPVYIHFYILIPFSTKINSNSFLLPHRIQQHFKFIIFDSKFRNFTSNHNIKKGRNKVQYTGFNKLKEDGD